MAKSKKTSNESSSVEQEFVPELQPVVVLPKEESIDGEKVRKRVLELRDDIGNNYTEICRHLFLIQQKGLYESWGYTSFRDYASKELQFKATKAMYLASIWKNLKENQDERVFEKVIPLGWSKAKELARVVTKENVDTWVDRAKYLGVDALIKEVRHEISSKRKDGGTPSEILEAEANVIGTPIAEEKKTISVTFDYEDYLTLMQACERIQTEIPGASIASVIGHVCREFLGADPGDSGWKFAEEQIRRLASVHEKKVVIIDAQSGDFDVGYEHVEGALKAALSDSVQPENLEDISGVFDG